MKVIFDGIVLDKFSSTKDDKTVRYIRVLSDRDQVTMRISDHIDLSNIPVMSKCTFEAYISFYNDKAYFHCKDLTVTAYANYKEI